MHYQLRITASEISFVLKNSILKIIKKSNLMLKMCIQTDQVNVSKYVSIFYDFSICLTCFYSIIEEILVSSSSGNRE